MSQKPTYDGVMHRLRDLRFRAEQVEAEASEVIRQIKAVEREAPRQFSENLQEDADHPELSDRWDVLYEPEMADAISEGIENWERLERLARVAEQTPTQCAGQTDIFGGIA